MKTVQKILLGALLIGIGCLASVKTVRAEVTLTYNASTGLKYTVTGESDTAEYAIVAKNGENTIPLASGTGNVGETPIDVDTLLTKLVTDETKAFPIIATVDGDKKAETSITVFCLKLTVSGDLDYTLSPATITPSLTDSDYTISVSAKSAPYYISSVTYTTPLDPSGGGTTDINATSRNIGLHASETYVINSESATPSININQTATSPIKATFSWAPEGVSYLSNDIDFVDKAGTGNVHQVISATYNNTTKEFTLEFTGNNRGTFIYSAGMTDAGKKV